MEKLLPRRKNEKEELVTIPSTNISDGDVAFELSGALTLKIGKKKDTDKSRTITVG